MGLRPAHNPTHSLLMPETRHLDHAPIVEALIHFQANAAERWSPETMRNELQPAWPEHTEVQEMRPVKFEWKLEAGKEPEQKISSPGVDGLFFRAPGQPTVYHARRDGLIVSWLAPYANWETFRDTALAAWAKFQEILAPEDLHTVALRYINRLEFPQTEFKLSNFFASPPAKPPDLADWGFLSFQHHTLFAPTDSRFAVQVIFTRIEGPPEIAAFILDIEVRLKESLAATTRSVEEVLEEMRLLKNKAFFGMLTPAVIERYKEP